MRLLLSFLSLFLIGTLHGQTWTNITTTGDIPPRANASMIYHATENAVYLFGGNTEDGFQNDLWKLDLTNNNWSEVMVTGAIPVIRHTHNAVFDESQNQMLVFSGQGNGLYNDIWSFDFNTLQWTERSPNGNAMGLPQKRYGTASVFDPDAQRLVTFGGFGNAGTARQDDTWAFDVNNDTWTELQPSTHPVKRCLHNGTYMPGRELMVIYGGQSGGNQEDIWSFDLATNSWTERLPTIKPPARHFCSLTAINEDQLYLFGGNSNGQNDFSGGLNDLWRFSFVDDSWTQILAINTVPPKRVGHSAIHLPDNDQLLIFGGNGVFSNFLNDLWIFEDLTTSIENIPQRSKTIQLKMYSSNPMSETLQFDLIVEKTTTVQLNLVDIQGRQMHDFDVQDLTKGKHGFLVNTNHLPSGIYFLQWEGNGEKQVYKMVK